MPSEIYCPWCARVLTVLAIVETEDGIECAVFEHDDEPHPEFFTDHDSQAMINGLQ